MIRKLKNVGKKLMAATISALLVGNIMTVSGPSLTFADDKDIKDNIGVINVGQTYEETDLSLALDGKEASNFKPGPSPATETFEKLGLTLNEDGTITGTVNEISADNPEGQRVVNVEFNLPGDIETQSHYENVTFYLEPEISVSTEAAKDGEGHILIQENKSDDMSSPVKFEVNGYWHVEVDVQLDDEADTNGCVIITEGAQEKYQDVQFDKSKLTAGEHTCILTFNEENVTDHVKDTTPSVTIKLYLYGPPTGIQVKENEKVISEGETIYQNYTATATADTFELALAVLEGYSSKAFAWSIDNKKFAIEPSEDGKTATLKEGTEKPTAGDYDVTVTVNGTGAEESVLTPVPRALKFVFGTDPAITTETSLVAGKVNEPYEVTLAATGYPNPTWKLVEKEGESLPKGLTLDSTGKITGTPTESGEFKFTVKCSNHFNDDQKEFTLKINAAPTITTDTLKAGKENEPYDVTLAATGYPDTFTWSLAADSSLPAGLTLEQGTGKISGEPTESGKFTFTVKCKNSLGDDSKEFTLEIYEAPTIKTEILSDGDVGEPYKDGDADVTLKATGYPEKFDWTLTGGALPGGLLLDSTGKITGTPTESGIFTFTVECSNDGSLASASKEFTLKIYPKWESDSGTEVVQTYTENEVRIAVEDNVDSALTSKVSSLVVEDQSYDKEVEAKIEAALSNKVEKMKIYDFKFKDKDGNDLESITLDSNVKVYVSIADLLNDGWDESRLAVYCVEEGKAIGHKIVERNGEKYIEFDTNHFSEYAIVEMEAEDSSDSSTDATTGDSTIGSSNASYLKTGDSVLTVIGILGIAILGAGALMFFRSKKEDNE